MPTKPEKNAQTEPLTVAHGRKIFDQSKEIANKLDALEPLLALLDPRDSAETEDPVRQIGVFLESLAVQSQRQTDLLKRLDSKLDYLCGFTKSDAS